MKLRNTIFSSLLAVVLCMSIIAGGTFALFTSTVENDIVVTSGKVDVTAVFSEPVMTTSISNAQAAVGTASINNGVISLSNMMPGDKATTTLTITNVGTVAALYRVKIDVTDGGLAPAMKLTVGSGAAKIGVASYTSGYTPLDVSATNGGLTISLELPEDTGNAFEDKSATYKVTVEAVQGNADVTGTETFTLINGATAVSAKGTTTVVASTAATVTANVAPNSTDTANTTTVDIPAGALGDNSGETVLTVDTYDTLAAGNFAVAGDGSVAGIDLSLVVTSNNVSTSVTNFVYPVTVTTYIAKGLTDVAVVYNGTGDAPTFKSYDSATGKLVFTTTHFSQFLVTSSSVSYIVETSTAYNNLQTAINNATDGNTIVMLKSITQDDGFKVDKDGSTINLDLNGKTITVNSGSTVNNRAIRIDKGTLNVCNGKIIAAGSGTTSSDGTGCYGAFRVEAGGKLIATDLTLENARPWGLNVKVCGGEAELTKVTINSSYGGGIEVTEAALGENSKKGKATLTNCTFTQTNYFDHCSSAVSVSGGSEVIVNGGSYKGEYALYVFSSGGVITVNDGEFEGLGNNERAAVIAAIDTNTYPEYTGGLKINGGSIKGEFEITSPAYMTITGGTFNTDPSAYVPAGYHATANEDGTWTVTANTAD